MILRLHAFWAAQGCVILQPYDMEMGAGTFHPATTLRALGPQPWSAAYVQPSRRPSDGRYGENPNRLQHYYQYQVILKPSPRDPQALLMDSYKALGLDPALHDIRFVEDDWESPTLGAWGPGLGSLVRRHGGDAVHLFPAGRRHRLRGAVLRADLRPRTAGHVHPGRGERVRPALQRRGMSYGDVFLRAEREYSAHNFEHADIGLLMRHFEDAEHECHVLVKAGLALPAYDHCIKASHRFNLLDARGAISVTERAAYIGRVRALAKACCETWLEQAA
jgi:glycyl-tRNA synthetase alpha chain